MDYSKIKPAEAREKLHSSISGCLREFMQSSPEMVEVSCPFCASEKKSIFFNIDEFKYYHCDGCGSIYSTPRLKQDQLNSYYSLIANTIEPQIIQREKYKQRTEIIMRPRWAMLKAKLLELGVKFPFNSILEVGPGVGYFTEVLQSENISKRYVLVEPDRSCQGILKKLPNSVIFNGALEECNAKKHGENDLLFINSVIEHPFDLVPFFNSVHKMLKKDGRVCLVDMNASGLDIEILRGDADNINPNIILQIGTVRGVSEISKRCGFIVEKFFSMGKMDADILFEYSQKQPSENRLSAFSRLLKDKNVRTDLQNLLSKYLITGYTGYILKKFNLKEF